MMWYNEMSGYLTFLKEAPSQALQQKLNDLEKAFKDCFNPKQPLKRFPHFKHKGEGDSLRFPQGFEIQEDRVKLPKLG